MPDLWLRPEFMDREGELETRTDFEKRTGITVQSLSSYFTRYADLLPRVAKMTGKRKYFVGAELDDFVQTIKKSPGNRSAVDVRRADLARMRKAIESAEGRVADRRHDLEKAERELARLRRQAKALTEEIEFLKQAQ